MSDNHPLPLTANSPMRKILKTTFEERKLRMIMLGFCHCGSERTIEDVSDTYQVMGCFNRHCPEWVQTQRKQQPEPTWTGA